MSERNEVAKQNPEIVATMLARLKVLSVDFETNYPINGSNEVFCNLVKERGGFLGPWID